MATESPEPTDIDSQAERAIGYPAGAAVSAQVCLGDQLGLYRALEEVGPATSGELAAAGLGER